MAILTEDSVTMYGYLMSPFEKEILIGTAGWERVDLVAFYTNTKHADKHDVIAWNNFHLITILIGHRP
jgi:hypothetical protein